MTDRQMRTLTAALGLQGGIVCAVGAGGKKSLLYALAGEATGRVSVTATAMILRFPHELGAQIVVEDEATLRQTLTNGADAVAPALLAYACPSDKHGRLAGVAPTIVDAIHSAGGFDLTLVKADGARMRGIKAPKPGEPVLPADTAVVLPVVSARVIGAALTERTAHRPERVAAVTGATMADTITPEHVGRLLAAGHGALQATDGMRVVPVINQVDDNQRHELAHAAARVALELSDRFDRVVLTCLQSDNHVVDVVERAH